MLGAAIYPITRKRLFCMSESLKAPPFALANFAKIAKEQRQTCECKCKMAAGWASRKLTEVQESSAGLPNLPFQATMVQTVSVVLLLALMQEVA